MISQEQVIQLLSKKMAGELLSPPEEREWNALEEKHKHLLAGGINEKDLLEVGSFYNEKELLWERLRKKCLEKGMIETTSPVVEPVAAINLFKRVWFRRFASAAAVVLVFITLYKLVNWYSSKKTVQVAQVQKQESIDPSRYRGRLILTDNSSIDLDSTVTGLITDQGSTRVMQPEKGQLVYDTSGSRKNNKVPANEMTTITLPAPTNVLITPRGGEYRLVLPDGTKVWLNVASQLRFPPVFTGHERIVELSGEAYFEVTKNAGRPFKVKLDKGISVRAIGTSFNVNAYSDEDSYKISLIEGGVLVTGKNDSVLLAPNQQALVSKTQTMQVIPMGEDAVSEATAWKKNLFYFNGTNFASVIFQLERWYNVDIQYPSQLDERTIHLGPKSRKVDITHILNIMQEMRKDNFKYRIEGKKVIISN